MTLTYNLVEKNSIMEDVISPLVIKQGEGEGMGLNGILGTSMSSFY